MALNTYKMWSNGIKIGFFPKNYEKLSRGSQLRPQTSMASGSWGLRPQTPVYDAFELQ